MAIGPRACRASYSRAEPPTRGSSVLLAPILPYFLTYFLKIIGPRSLCLMLIKFSAYRARQSSVFFSFSSVISFKIRENTEESVWLEALVEFQDRLQTLIDCAHGQDGNFHDSWRQNGDAFTSAAIQGGLSSRTYAYTIVYSC